MVGSHSFPYLSIRSPLPEGYFDPLLRSSTLVYLNGQAPNQLRNHRIRNGLTNFGNVCSVSGDTDLCAEEADGLPDLRSVLWM